MEPAIKAVLIIKLALGIASLVAMLIASIWYRVAQEIKIKQLPSEARNTKRMLPFFIINISHMPNSKEVDEFRVYNKNLTIRFLVVFGLAVSAFIVSYFLPVKMEVR
jgi:hypothetical protein